MTKADKAPHIDPEELEVADGRHMRLHSKQVQETMDRYALFRGMHIALKLHDTDCQYLMQKGGMPTSISQCQDLMRRFDENNPRRSRRVYEEHVLALIDGILAVEEGDLPIEPHQTLVLMLQGIKTAIGAGEPWAFTGPALQNRIDHEIKSHRGD